MNSDLMIGYLSAGRGNSVGYSSYLPRVFLDPRLQSWSASSLWTSVFSVVCWVQLTLVPRKIVSQLLNHW